MRQTILDTKLKIFWQYTDRYKDSKLIVMQHLLCSASFPCYPKLLYLNLFYVLGINCANKSPTPQAANDVMERGVKVASSKQVRGCKFMQEFKVHVETTDDYITVPYFFLPRTILEVSIVSCCLACFDFSYELAEMVWAAWEFESTSSSYH